MRVAAKTQTTAEPTRRVNGGPGITGGLPREFKAAAETRRAEVFDQGMARRDRTPRTAQRYTIEMMPAACRKAAMARA